MTFRESCKPYFIGPIMSNKPNEQIDGNGILYTGVYFSILKLLGELDKLTDFDHLDQIYFKCKVAPGLIDHGIDNLSQEDHDDYIGLTRASQILDKSIAKEVLAYGRAHFYIYNNRGLTGISELFKQLLGRYAGFIQHLKMCADDEHSQPETLNAIEQILWVIGLLTSKSDASATQLSWVMVQTYKDYRVKTPIMDWAVKVWEGKVSGSNSPGLMGQVFAVFFNIVHPFATFMEGKI